LSAACCWRWCRTARRIKVVARIAMQHQQSETQLPMSRSLTAESNSRTDASASSGGWLKPSEYSSSCTDDHPSREGEGGHQSGRAGSASALFSKCAAWRGRRCESKGRSGNNGCGCSTGTWSLLSRETATAICPTSPELSAAAGCSTVGTCASIERSFVLPLCKSRVFGTRRMWSVSVLERGSCVTNSSCC